MKEAMNYDCVLIYMQHNHIPMTVEKYLLLAYFGDKRFEDLEGEELIAVEDLIEDGRLVHA